MHATARRGRCCAASPGFWAGPGRLCRAAARAAAASLSPGAGQPGFARDSDSGCRCQPESAGQPSPAAVNVTPGPARRAPYPGVMSIQIPPAGPGGPPRTSLWPSCNLKVTGAASLRPARHGRHLQGHHCYYDSLSAPTGQPASAVSVC